LAVRVRVRVRAWRREEERGGGRRRRRRREEEGGGGGGTHLVSRLKRSRACLMASFPAKYCNYTTGKTGQQHISGGGGGGGWWGWGAASSSTF